MPAGQSQGIRHDVAPTTSHFEGYAFVSSNHAARVARQPREISACQRLLTNS
jgi:hypothetical protein